MNTDVSNRFVDLLYEQYYDKMRVFCITFIGKDSARLYIVDECIQDVFLTAFTNQEKLCAHPNLEAWLLKACKYRMNTKCKKHKQRSSISAYSLDVEGASDVCQDETTSYDIAAWEKSADEKYLINLILSHLSERDSTLLKDYYLLGKSLQSLADARHTTVGTVKVALHRAKKRAREFCLSHKISLLLLLTFLLLVIFI